MTLIDKNIDQIKELCHNYKVTQLFVFGSVLSTNFKDHSDIDFLVDFSDVAIYDYADNYFDFKKSLENLLKREVDLLESKAIKNPYLKASIDSSKQKIYG